jgi:hypothetical protein
MTNVNEPVDLFELEERVREQVFAEFVQAKAAVEKLSSESRTRMTKWENAVGQCKERLEKERLDNSLVSLDEVMDEIVRVFKVVRDFEVIMNEINGNLLLKSQWDKLLMTMRLVHNSEPE